MRAAYCKYKLKFKQVAITSRDRMLEKETYFVKVWNDCNRDIYGIGECAIFRGLSADDRDDYEELLSEICRNINHFDGDRLTSLSSIKFGLETALNDLSNGGNRMIFPSSWNNGNSSIQINGLVWMGTFEEMYRRINEKLAEGFNCIKLKIGGIDFDRELSLLKFIREKFPAKQLEIRLDANGAFTPGKAMERLSQLSEYSIHSIEQPIKQGQVEQMAQLCEMSPIAIALDEELIGINCCEEKERLLSVIKPQYIILKPSLCGGFSGADEWISLAGKYGVRWWATSALESNIGLNAIAQWVSTYNPAIPQGLGTGQLYLNNITSPLEQTGELLTYNAKLRWEIPALNWVEP